MISGVRSLHKRADRRMHERLRTDGYIHNLPASDGPHSPRAAAQINKENKDKLINKQTRLLYGMHSRFAPLAVRVNNRKKATL